MVDLSKLNLPGRRVYLRNASVTRRLVAFLADLLLLEIGILSAFAAVFGGFSYRSLLDGSFVFTTPMYAATIVMALLGLAYFALFEYVLGQTPGMMLLNLKAENVTLWRALIRNLYFLPLFPFPFLALVEPFYLVFRKTRFLELVSGTRTVEYLIA